MTALYMAPVSINTYPSAFAKRLAKVLFPVEECPSMAMIISGMLQVDIQSEKARIDRSCVFGKGITKLEIVYF